MTHGEARTYGRIVVPCYILKRDENLARAIFVDMIVLHMVSDYSRDVAVYYVNHPSFDPVDHGEQMPFYDAKITRYDDPFYPDEPVYSVIWRRVETLSEHEAPLIGEKVEVSHVDPRD